LISNVKVFIKGEQHPEFVPEKWIDLELIATFSDGSLQASLSDNTNLSSTGVTFIGEGARRI